MSYTCYNCFQEKPDNETCPFCGYVPENEGEKYPNALHPGSILNGKYIVGRVIGQGGFGITYIAKDYQTGERVAIKEYLPSEFAGRSGNSVQAFSKDQKENFEYGKEQFLSEAKTLAAFNGDEHIVRIFSFFEENNTAYFAMEYVDGLALDKYMAQQGGRLTVAEANRLLLPLMESLNKVHAKGIVHRDIAPDNIIVTKDGSVKLIDFGAARYSTGEKSRSLDVILKHGFAPPEQYMRRGRQGPFTDVYALAATYYYAITGKLLPDSVERTFEDTIMLPRTLGVKISRKQEDALLKALEVNAANRYQNMGEFHHEMAQASGIKAETTFFKQQANADLSPAFSQTEQEQKEKEARRRAEKAQKKAKTAGQSKTKKRTIPAIVITIVCLTLILVAVKLILPRVIQEKNIKDWENVEVGSIVILGNYEQDNDLSNGKEPIEWRVLDIQNGRALLLSRYALDCKTFNYTNANITWEECTLRIWLNDTFLKTAFSSNEQALIPKVTVSADKNPSYSTNSGNSTLDQLFLLSIPEVDRYFSSDTERQCKPTEYAKAQGAYVNANTGTCWWWLRSPGNYSYYAAYVNNFGSFLNLSYYVSYSYPVRPALWVDLEAATSLSISSAEVPEKTTGTEPISESIEHSNEEIEEIKSDSTIKHEIKELKEASVGDYVLFGNYEQDNDLANGKEPIEWLVLDVQGNRVLLLSGYALDCQPYNTVFENVTWETCSLRTWLNNDFLNDAFSSENQIAILTTTIDNKSNQHLSVWSTYGGNFTKDMIFLLSDSETREYLPANKEKRCQLTEYAIKQGAAHTNESAWWWLRSPGGNNSSASYVKGETIYKYGRDVNGSDAVRPALWIDLNKVG